MADARADVGSERTRRVRKRRAPLAVAGWREWVTLPDMSPVPLKAKLDTGARTSALHAFALEIVSGADGPLAAFELHPMQRSSSGAVRVVEPVTAFRRVRSSNGKTENRPVVTTNVRLGADTWPIEVTLTSRDAMGFRMLLGRAALRRHYLVDPGRSFLMSTQAEVES